MVLMQHGLVMLADGVSPSLFSWQYLKDAYYSYLMTNTVATVCLAAYIIIALAMVAFLLQPKKSRTLARRRCAASTLGSCSATTQTAIQEADRSHVPVIQRNPEGPVVLPADSAHAISPGHHMPSLPPKTNMAMLNPSSANPVVAAVLYVTDNDSSEHLIDSLGASGFAVISSPPGREAAHHASVGRFDIVVVDTLVAEAARLCATRLLEALPPRPATPLLIIANSPGQTLSLAATNARIDYIYRPFDDGFLVAKVHSMLMQCRTTSADNGAGAASSALYDKQMEKLVDSLPGVADSIQSASEQQSLSNVELQSAVLTALGEDAATLLQAGMDSGQPALADEVRETTDKVDELLRLCATVRPPKPKDWPSS